MQRGLRRLFGARSSPPDATARERLEARLEARVAQRRGSDHRVGAPRRWAFATRLAVGATVAAAVTVGACQVPTEVELDMGLRVDLRVEPGPNTEAQLETLGANLERVMSATRKPGATRHVARVDMRVMLEEREGMPPRMVVTIDMWATGLDEVTVIDTITETLPRADVTDVHRVEGSVHTTVGDRFAHELFDVDLDAENVEEARARILADLEARGLADGAQVEVTDEDGHRKVEVRVRQGHGGPAEKSAAPRHENPAAP